MRIRMLAPDQQVNGDPVEVGQTVDDPNAAHARWLIRNGLARAVEDKPAAKPAAGKAEKKKEAAK